jgi:predicted Zn-dependent protease with MMP-like domain
VPIRRRGAQSRRQPGRRAAVPASRHDRFERHVERALAALPPAAQRLLEQVAIVIEDEPGRDQLGEHGMEPGDTLYGLYEGTPIVEWGADSVPFPNKITLFRLPLEEDFAHPDDLADEVKRTVLHELGHHVGIDDHRLAELDLD